MTAKASLTVNRLKRWLPGLQIVREYQAAWFARDLMAGLVLTTMLVPVGIAYALASAVPEISGRIPRTLPFLPTRLLGPTASLGLGRDSFPPPVFLPAGFLL